MHNDTKEQIEEKATPELTFVVIGFNEAKTLRPCLQSIRDAHLEGVSYEILYVDGGSQDDCVEIARGFGVDKLLGGEKRRRAAENRNVGLHAAGGVFVQFVDGDMTLDPEWPKAGLDFLRTHPEFSAVYGELREVNTSLLFRVLQLDWAPWEGEALYCGGAAMFRRETLVQVGGFPEDVTSGEEPYLCWRIRNELKKRIYKLKRIMAGHDLGFRGFRDYWRRTVRTGGAYAEVAARCFHSNDRFWLRECVSNMTWSLASCLAVVALCTGPNWLRAAVGLILAAVLGRKTVQTLLRGQPFPVAVLYALHTYFSKLALGYGQLKWWLFGRAAR